MSPLRVLHVITALDPAAGGPPVVAPRLGAAPAAHGCTVTLVAYKGDEAGHQRALDLIAETPGSEALRASWIPRGGAAESLTGRAAAAALQQTLRDETDVLHVHGMWEMMLPAAASVARRNRAPYGIAPHGMLDPAVYKVRRWKKDLALASTHRSFLRRASCLHMLNRDEVDLARPLTKDVPTRVIPNGIFESEFDALPEPGRLRDKFKELGGDPIILFLSRLQHKKGLDYLVDAFAIVAREDPRVRLVIAGPDGGEERPTRQRIDKLGVGDRVHLVGPLYGEDKLAALRDATVFCLPSRQEGFSIAITEALAVGLPVVVTKACHYPEVTEAGAGIETELDSQDVADALLAILGDPDRAREMGQSGAKLVRERFTWPVVGRASIEMYDQVRGEANA
ncbi:MAG: glycosyltransferase [Phycisphaerales bacterium]